MKVIGAGLPRTATLTQKISLEMLGLGPCYHMVNVLGNLDQTDVWRGILEGDGDLAKPLEHFQSCVDWPTSFYYKELMEMYPDAKVVLSVRTPESWARSMDETIVDSLIGDSLAFHVSAAAGHLNTKWAEYLELMTEMWTKAGVLDAGDHHRLDLGAAFNRHNDEVERTVPADKLLVWQPADGWEPLCEFLELDVPDAPLPRVNDKETYTARIIDMSLGTLNEWWQRERPEALGAPRPPAQAPVG
jgi:hypothetical protein